MARIFLIAFLCLHFGAADLYSQGFAAYEKAAEAAISDQNYRSAYTYYRFLFEQQPGHTDYLYQFAEAARKYKAFQLAADGYKGVLASPDAANFPLTGFHLGMVLKSRGEYDEAIAQLTTFINTYRGVDSIVGFDSSFIIRAEKEVDFCSWAKEQVSLSSSPIDSLIYLDTISWKGINSPFSDLSPVWRDNRLYFSSVRFPNAGDKYETPRPLSKILEVGLEADLSMTGPGNLLDEVDQSAGVHFAHPAFNGAGNRMYFSRCVYTKGLDMSCSLYFVEYDREEDKWGDTINIGPMINGSGIHNAQPTLTENFSTEGEVMFFASNRPGGYGGMDIYLAPLDEGGFPISIEPISGINTTGDDMTPFFDSKNRLLYFSSDGHPSMGGFDLYYTKYRNGKWRPAEHLGHPVNSSFDENYLSVDSSGALAFFTSNRPGVLFPDEEAMTCCPDIFSTHIDHIDVILELAPTVSGQQLLDSVSFTLINEDLGELQVFSNGSQEMVTQELETGFAYKVIAEKAGYVSDTLAFQTLGIRADTVLHPKIDLVPRIDLEIAVFDGFTEDPLSGLGVERIDESGERTKILVQDLSHQFRMVDLKPEEQCKVKISCEGYVSKTKEISIGALLKPQTIFLHVNLLRSKTDTLSLYFDNDRPGPRRRGVTMPDTEYENNIGEYLDIRYKEYQRQYKNPSAFPCKGQFSEAEFEALAAFFDTQIRGNYDRLKEYESQIIHYLDNLEKGQQLVLYIKGYASSSGPSSYNKWLTDRRIESVRVLLASIFVKNLKTGNLKLIKDSRSNQDALRQGVPGRKESPCEAQYGLDAIKARRVEILGVVEDFGTEDNSSMPQPQIGGKK